MTVIELAKSRKWSEHRKMQRRQARDAAMGPNCPNDHPWATNAKFDYLHRRFCDACTREKAEKRRNDPMTYTGYCPQGHPYTRENTVIVVTQNSKVCLTCKRAASARARVLNADLIPKILDLARQGATRNALLARGPNRLGKALAPNTVTLTRLTKLKTPEGRELKQLFEQNRKMAHIMRYGVNAWLPAKREFLAAQFQKTHNLEAIATALNDRFGSDHTLKAVEARASKWKIRRDISYRLVLVEPAPASLRFPPGSLMERLVALLPKNLARDHRDDLISEIALAVFEGRVPEAELEAHVRVLVRRSFNADHDQWGDVSLDTTIPGTDLRRIDTISEGLWG